MSSDDFKGKTIKQGVNVIILDLDGALVDSEADTQSSVCYALKHVQKPIQQNEISNYVRTGPVKVIKNCLCGCEEALIKEAIAEFRRHYIENCVVETTLYKEVKEILEHFKNKKIGIVTNKSEIMTSKILETLQIKDYIGIIVGPESVKKIKPDPEGLLKVLDYFGEKASNAIMVGDSSTDVEAGKSAGTLTCGVTYGFGDREELENSKPDFLIDHIGKIVEFIA